MLHKKSAQENVAFGLAVLKYYLRFNSKENLQDANVSSEELISNLINILKDTNFVCTSEISATYPGIDALDKENKLGLQITHTKNTSKINKTIDKIRINKVNEEIDTLYFFITSERQKKYTIKAQCPKLNVTTNNILDFDDLAKLLSKSQDKLSKAESELMKAMPHLYQEGKERYQAMLNNILETRNKLDRRVFTANKILEEPEEMLLSLKEIRIDIQKDGIMNKANPAVSDSFNKIINIIDDVESKIAVQYPDEYKKYKAKILPSWNSPEKEECLDILMAIRKDVLKQIDNIDIEVNKLKSILDNNI
ncbi:SMEK domain-containing protein [Escherichia coli]